ncbi:MAG TPA: hypothetical protein DCY13_21285 [Verrucomicrobiales bacterium]|nr:hypothetical protein [Verrucomicrobiales bacterium]
MKRLAYLPVATAIAALQTLPLATVAWLGRQLGLLGWLCDTTHRNLARRNLALAFGDELDDAERSRLARESFRRLGESWLCALRTVTMEREELSTRLQVVGLNKLQPWIERTDVAGIVVATGHFANIEMYAHAAAELPWMRPVTLYRRSPSWMMNRILSLVRRDAPCDFFDDVSEVLQLRSALRDGNLILGVMADLNPGPAGVRVPFFGRPASTSPAAVVYALRHRMPLHAAVCFRIGPGRWRVEISDEIPTRPGGRARRVPDILFDLNAHLEQSIRRDPANWFWMQPRWLHPGRLPSRWKKTHV